MTATLDTQALKRLDQAHHLHPFTDFEDYARHGGRIVSRAEHVYIYDSDGNNCLLYTSPSPRDLSTSRMPSSA